MLVLAGGKTEPSVLFAKFVWLRRRRRMGEHGDAAFGVDRADRGRA